MQFLTKRQIRYFTTAHLIGLVLCILMVEAKDQNLNTREEYAGTPYLRWWEKENYEPVLKFWPTAEREERRGKGDCQFFGTVQDRIASAVAPEGWKCTLYEHEGCHGARTREFDRGGIPGLGDKMKGRASAWRCCQIGKVNYWGMCEAKLNPGS